MTKELKITRQSASKRAKQLKTSVEQITKDKVKLGHCYEVVGRAFGCKSWQVLSHLMEQGPFVCEPQMIHIEEMVRELKKGLLKGHGKGPAQKLIANIYGFKGWEVLLVAIGEQVGTFVEGEPFVPGTFEHFEKVVKSGLEKPTDIPVSLMEDFERLYSEFHTFDEEYDVVLRILSVDKQKHLRSEWRELEKQVGRRVEFEEVKDFWLELESAKRSFAREVSGTLDHGSFNHLVLELATYKGFEWNYLPEDSKYVFNIKMEYVGDPAKRVSGKFILSSRILEQIVGTGSLGLYDSLGDAYSAGLYFMNSLSYFDLLKRSSVSPSKIIDVLDWDLTEEVFNETMSR